MTTWAISGVDLLLDLPRGRGIRAALEHALRDAVRTGRFPAGTRLPSSRQLAHDLGLARNTVAEVYTQLIAEGYLTGRPGAGTVVARLRSPRRAGRHPEPRTLARPIRYSLRPGTPDLSLFPRDTWLASMHRVLASAPHDVFGYADPRGAPQLREALARYLARARGVAADPDLMVVCAGYTQAVALLVRALVRGRGTRVAIETPGLPYLPDLVRRHGARAVPIPVDHSGARTDLLAPGRRDGPAAVVLTPAHQFPTGTLLAPERRATVIEWARTRQGLVIEDDYDGEFRYDRKPVGALQGMASDCVAYVGTASKALAPALRLAWLQVPARLIDLVVAEKRFLDRHSPVLDQLAFADMLETGAYDRQVHRARAIYRRRRERLEAVLAERPSLVEIVGMRAGLQALARFPGADDEFEDRVVRAAADRGLHVAGLRGFEHTRERHWGPGLVIGFAAPSQHAFEGALDALRDALDAAPGPAAGPPRA